jgi:hypothetical protein
LVKLHRLSRLLADEDAARQHVAAALLLPLLLSLLLLERCRHHIVVGTRIQRQCRPRSPLILVVKALVPGLPQLPAFRCEPGCHAQQQLPLVGAKAPHAHQLAACGGRQAVEEASQLVCEVQQEGSDRTVRV